MSSNPHPEPRRHHYVPTCWLAGFTEDGDKGGKLWVTDLRQRKQWPTNPGNAGFIRDFYRLSDEQMDPVFAEKALSQIEGEIAPILRSVDQELRPPDEDEFEALLYFIAIQWARVPTFRPFILNVLDTMSDEFFAEALKDPESWKRALEKAGISAEAPDAEYKRMKVLHASKAHTLSPSTDWYVQRTFQAAVDILPSLRKRFWGAAYSPSGNFIGSDSPVILEGQRGQVVGFENAEFVIWPLSRHVLLYATLERMRPKRVNRKYIAHMNTLTLLRAEKQVFSHAPDFCWEDEDRNYQTNWTRFSKEKY